MIAYLSAATQRPGRRLLVSVASIALLATGCSNLISTAPISEEASSPGKIGGRVHGGNQPVAGATVNLYFAGQSGHASPATLVATTTTADDNTGSFSFTKLPDSNTINPTTNTFSCPISGPERKIICVRRRSRRKHAQHTRFVRQQHRRRLYRADGTLQSDLVVDLCLHE